MVFGISDLHLSFSTDKPMSVFKGWDRYEERIEKNWRKLIGPNDTVVLPGDLSWAMKLEHTAADFAFIHQLPGKKIISKGNHDLWWSTVSKMTAFLEQQGFTSISILNNNAFPAESIAVCGTRGWMMNDETAGEKMLAREAGRLRASLEAGIQTGLEPVAFLHYPPVYDGVACEPMMAVLKEYGVKRCYYGHVHRPGALRACRGTFEGIRFAPLSCDLIDFCPVLVE